MAVYYRFKSARDTYSISMDGPLISVGTLKEKIYESMHLGGTDSDLLVTNAQTNEEYMGEMLIPRNTSVLIRRVPGRPRMLEPKPPQGYVCHRCKVPGHFIQHCPTNGDPKYDVKRFKHPTGIPKSMLIATPDGSYALPSGVVAVLRPNEAAFEKEIEGLPSPTISAASKGEQRPPPGFEETLVPKEITDEGKAVIAPPQTRIAAKAPDVSKATHESMSVKEPAPASQVLEEQVQQQKKKKNKKQHPHMPSNDLQWKTYPQDMMPLGPSAYNNPYWNDMQSGNVAPFGGAMPYMVMGYGMSPIDMIFGGVMPQDPFGAQGYMMPVVPPQREFHRSESSSKPSSETAIKAASTTWNKKSEAVVFSRINFPKQEAINAAKKRKMSSSSATTEAVPSAHHKSSSSGYYESSAAKAMKSSSGARGRLQDMTNRVRREDENENEKENVNLHIYR